MRTHILTLLATLILTPVTLTLTNPTTCHAQQITIQEESISSMIDASHNALDAYYKDLNTLQLSPKEAKPLQAQLTSISHHLRTLKTSLRRAPTHGPNITLNPSTMLASIDQASLHLDLLVQTTQKHKSIQPQERWTLTRHIDRVQDTLHTLRRTLQRASKIPPKPPKITPPAQPSTISTKDFTKLLNTTRSHTFTKDKMASISRASSRHFFTTRQTVALLQTLSFDKDRVSAALLLYPRTVDRDKDWDLVYTTITFDSHRRELRNSIQSISTRSD